ncbi:hypothetical protein [Hippea alviniae]|uniref:hypothetical protein n=1 Tax=Hippea alviniae TaxID=1279027 RepID=UPI0003B648C0|nr:hypothetical protein [Hippea alviniae]
MDAFTITFVVLAVVIIGLKFAYYKATGDKEGLKSKTKSFNNMFYDDNTHTIKHSTGHATFSSCTYIDDTTKF